MRVANMAWRGVLALPVLTVLATCDLTEPPAANAGNKRLNDSVVANVHPSQHQAGCKNNLTINPQLRLVAQWHTDDVLSNAALDGDIGTEGSTAQDRANAAGFKESATETVAINPTLAMTGIEFLNQWYYNPDDMAIMSNCANPQMGVWSGNSLGRTVVFAVYGFP
jgi:uncharacterized protein YkwD